MKSDVDVFKSGIDPDKGKQPYLKKNTLKALDITQNGSVSA